MSNTEHQSGGTTMRARSELWLHGEDFFKSSCCYCRAEIEPNAPRTVDLWGNYYCGDECMAYAMVAVHKMYVGGELPEPSADVADWAQAMVANEVVADG